MQVGGAHGCIVWRGCVCVVRRGEGSGQPSAFLENGVVHNPVQADLHAAQLFSVLACLTSNLNIPVKWIPFWCLLKSVISLKK